MKFKLRKDAPWPEVTLPEGQVITSKKWIDVFESKSLAAIKKYLEYNENPPKEESNVEEVEKEVVESIIEEIIEEEFLVKEEGDILDITQKTIDSYTKKELQEFCDKNNIAYTSSDKKADLIAKIKAADEDPVLASDEIV